MRPPNRTAEQHQQLLLHRQAARHSSTASVPEVDEDPSLGFGVDDDDVLGSRHFRQHPMPPLHPGGSSGEGDGDGSGGGLPHLAPVRVRPPLGGRGLLEGLGSPTAAAVASPPIRRVGTDAGSMPFGAGGGGGGGGGHAKRLSYDQDDVVLQGDLDGTGLLGPSALSGAPVSSPLQGARRVTGLPQGQPSRFGAAAHGNGAGAGGGAGVSPLWDASGGHTNGTVDALLVGPAAAAAAPSPESARYLGIFNGGAYAAFNDEDALLSPAAFKRGGAGGGGFGGEAGGFGGGAGGGHGGGLHGSGDEWGVGLDRVASTPLDMSSHQRLFTPPIVPPSKVLQAHRAGHEPQQQPQVLVLGGDKPGNGAAGGVKRNGGEEMVDLVYDPVLNCYYDAKTNKYYELKN